MLKRAVRKNESGEWSCSVWFADPAKAKALAWYLPYFGFAGGVELVVGADGVRANVRLAEGTLLEEWLARLQDFEISVRKFERKHQGDFDEALFRAETLLFPES